MFTSYGIAGIPAIVLVSMSGAAQQSTGAPVKGMASTVGLYVFPQKQQSAAQQLTDEQQCFNNAESQTAFDPNATTTASNGTVKIKRDHGAAKGALGGAALSPLLLVVTPQWGTPRSSRRRGSCEAQRTKIRGAGGKAIRR